VYKKTINRSAIAFYVPTTTL